MQKILFVANIHKHFNAFHLPYINYLKKSGYEVHVAANDPDTIVEQADKQFTIPIDRNPFSLNNVRAYFELKKIIDTEGYVLIHCHTAMGSVVARLAARQQLINGALHVLYTAHGFHFFKGSPKSYWMLYYPMELYLSKFTDAIIVINNEDYELICRKPFKNKQTFKISGIGLDLHKFSTASIGRKHDYREKNNYTSDQFLIIYIAEFIDRKNHKFIIDCAALLQNFGIDFKFLFAGRGVLRSQLEDYAHSVGASRYIDFLGFRNDIGELITMSDVGVSVSRQEGLGMNLVELMFCGVPVVATNIRGHNELIDHGRNGFLFTPGDRQAFVDYIYRLYKDKNLRQRIGSIASESSKKYDLSNSLQQMSEIYSQYLKL